MLDCYGQRETTDKPRKTRKGFLIQRRCDACGTRIELASDEGDKCTLICGQCGKEYRFYVGGR